VRAIPDSQAILCDFPNAELALYSSGLANSI